MTLLSGATRRPEETGTHNEKSAHGVRPKCQVSNMERPCKQGDISGGDDDENRTQYQLAPELREARDRRAKRWNEGEQEKAYVSLKKHQMRITITGEHTQSA